MNKGSTVLILLRNNNIIFLTINLKYLQDASRILKICNIMIITKNNTGNKITWKQQDLKFVLPLKRKTGLHKFEYLTMRKGMKG